MLYLFDIRSLSVISSIISLILCICMIYVSRTRKIYNGFMQWTIASILYCFALAFMGFRNVLPDFLSIIVANTLLITGKGLIAYGLELFTNSTRRIWLFLSLTLSMVILFIYFTYFSPDVNARIVIVSTTMAILCGYSGYIVHKNVPRLIDGQNRFLVAVFSIQTLWLILRIVQTAFVESPIVDFINASAFHGITVILFFGGNIFLVIGLIVLNFQRVEYDLSAAMAELKTLKGIVPICSYCKNIRDDKGFWSQVEAYVTKHTEAEFSHSICPQCIAKHYPEYEDQITDKDI
ncbi:hypothetical protein [Desulforhopalus sp. IMCC35007]|uniref:hypothetical protein n=1 Tax=Desulforhopalus sp. IMCC35007 TaxID=2569543 RepID=UPI0010AE85CE|nr:hypothetical protein [Desulforhopalus sp. IMCC35007]TKB07634.1 hypothetical protein FCL48_16530 [Desulforhopalus sp. IMCC35007]